MPKCNKCNKDISFFEYNIFTGVCEKCDAPQEIQASSISQDQKMNQSSAQQPTNQVDPPVSGPILVGISLVVALIGGFLFENSDTHIVGVIVLGVVSITYLIGIIRWGDSGAETHQINRIEKQLTQIESQNSEIIELLEIIAEKGTTGTDMPLLRRLRESGQISVEEFRKERKETLLPSDKSTVESAGTKTSNRLKNDGNAK
jgi:hypothetical protein